MEGNVFFFDWEVRLISWIQANLSDFGVKLFSFFSFFGEELFLVAALTLIYFCINKKEGKKIGLILVLIQAMVPLIKNIFNRRRPYMDNDNITLLKLIDKNASAMDIKAQGFSFPSGHSANASGLYGAIAYESKRKWVYISAIILTLLVGISRFALGAHFPTDVIVGYLIGIFCIVLINVLEKYIKKDYIRYLIIIAISLPALFYATSNDYYTGLGMLVGCCLGFLFEDRFVKFEDTKNIISKILRFVIAIGLYFGLNALLKLPFEKSFLESGTKLALLVRLARYTIILFLLSGPYTLLFKYFDKIHFKKKKD